MSERSQSPRTRVRCAQIACRPALHEVVQVAPLHRSILEDSMRLLPRHRRRLRAAAAVATLAFGAVHVSEMRAAPVTVQIIEPSALPQTWGYSPQPKTVAAGDIVTWVNDGAAPHTVTASDG